MNRIQKKLTLLALAVFTLSVLFAPWDLTGSPNHTNVLRYAPLFAPPPMEVWSKRELASGILWSWFALVVIYSGLFVVLGDMKTSSQGGKDEQKAHA